MIYVKKKLMAYLSSAKHDVVWEYFRAGVFETTTY